MTNPVLVRVIVINCVFSNRRAKTRRIVRQVRDRYAARHDNVVWLMVETKRGRVRRWLGRRQWRGRQGWLPGRSNNAVAWDTDTGPVGPQGRVWRLLVAPHGHALLPRWMNRVRLHRAWWTVLHQPPSRDAELYPEAMRNLDRAITDTGETVAGDQNAAPVEEWARRRGMNYRHAGVMFLATRHRIVRFDAVHVNGLDHMVLVVDLEV